MREQGSSRLNDERNNRWYIPTLAAGLYFAQGLPFGIVNYTIPIYLSVHGISATQVGLFNAIGFAWTAKLAWAPAVDLRSTYRRWIQVALIVLTITIGALGIVPPAGLAFWIIASILAIASATQDIAIDALTIRMTPKDLIGPVNSARVTAYRVAIIAAGGGIAAIADATGWQGAFFVAAAITVVLLALTFALPVVEQPAEMHENPFRSLGRWLSRPRAITMLVVVLLYRIGESTVTPMITKYWAVRGYSATEIGTVISTIGMICTIAGAIAGGAFVARYGIYRGLLWLGVIQMASNITYAIVAMTNAGRAPMYATQVVEAFCNGLGTAAFLSFLMAICDKENAATEYAMLSAVFALSRTLFGTFSGIAADRLGWAPFFWLTVLLGIPGLLFLPAIRERLNAAA
jgi:MFS transporter, PAT family, beta-lactamase induction signal transducer AmpG